MFLCLYLPTEIQIWFLNTLKEKKNQISKFSLFLLQRCCSVKCDCYTTAYSPRTANEESGSVHACVNSIRLLQSKAYRWSSLSSPCRSQEADWFFRVCLNLYTLLLLLRFWIQVYLFPPLSVLSVHMCMQVFISSCIQQLLVFCPVQGYVCWWSHCRVFPLGQVMIGGRSLNNLSLC